MAKKQKEKPMVTINDKEYVYEDMTDEQKTIINHINDFLLKGIKVNFTFLNTVSKKNMRKRLKIRKQLNRYDQFSDKFYDNVQKGFLKILNKNPKKYMKIDSNKSINHNENIILDKVKRLIKI